MVSEQVSLKNIILKYLEGEEFPDYFKISKMFGLSYKEIFSLLGIKKYKLVQTNIYENLFVPQFWNPPNITEIQIYNDDNYLIYQVYKDSGCIKHVYDDLGRKLESIDSNGYCVKYDEEEKTLKERLEERLRRLSSEVQLELE